MKQCKDCEWWDGRGPYGDCCKKSPVVIIDGYEVGSSGHTTVWPETGENDGCGDFKMRGTEPKPEPDPGSSASIIVLNLSTRSYNCLSRLNIRTIGQLKAMPAVQLLRTRNFGPKCLREVQKKIADYEQQGEQKNETNRT